MVDIRTRRQKHWEQLKSIGVTRSIEKGRATLAVTLVDYLAQNKVRVSQPNRNVISRETSGTKEESKDAMTAYGVNCKRQCACRIQAKTRQVKFGPPSVGKAEELHHLCIVFSQFASRCVGSGGVGGDNRVAIGRRVRNDHGREWHAW